jgi:pyrroline-5-carboxylate reductase
METNSLGFIGGGRNTWIFLQALQNKNVSFGRVVVFDTNKEIIERLKDNYAVVEKAESMSEAAGQSIVFIALHPPIIMEMLDQIKDAVSKDTIIVSLAPKITLNRIASKLSTGNIMRMIPNATSYINEGYNPVTFAETFNPEYKSRIMNLIELLGETFEVEEEKLEAYAILSAMLPTYFWFQWNELANIGTQIGLTESESKASVKNTIIAANHLMFQSGLTAEQVIDLIPVKPIRENETQIKEIYQTKLTGLYEKIKP